MPATGVSPDLRSWTRAHWPDHKARQASSADGLCSGGERENDASAPMLRLPFRPMPERCRGTPMPNEGASPRASRHDRTARSVARPSTRSVAPYTMPSSRPRPEGSDAKDDLSAASGVPLARQKESLFQNRSLTLAPSPPHSFHTARAGQGKIFSGHVVRLSYSLVSGSGTCRA
jgi:hypothetical protein